MPVISACRGVFESALRRQAGYKERARAGRVYADSNVPSGAGKIAWQKRRIQYYEHRNNPSSTMSLRNKQLKKFKAGLRAKGKDGGAEEPEKPRRMGPPRGHAGVSHSDKPERIVRIPFKRCARCSSARVEQRRSYTKLARDFGLDNRVHTVALIVGEGVCLDCGARSKAPTGVLEGTSFGPRLLGTVDEYFHVNCTDAAIARVLERVHGFKTSPNSVLNAREALADSLRRHQIEQIMDGFSKYIYVIGDETFFAYMGKKGVVWVMLVPTAVLVSFEITRAAWVLEERFGWLCAKMVVADGYGPYKTFFALIQRDWVHVLRHALDSLVRITEAAKEAKERDRPQAEAARDLAECAHADLHALREAAHRTALAPLHRPRPGARGAQARPDVRPRVRDRAVQRGAGPVHVRLEKRGAGQHGPRRGHHTRRAGAAEERQAPDDKQEGQGEVFCAGLVQPHVRAQ